ncbi:MAG: winged helix-turn-helix transcriptional regulator [Alphaproteobacteria bacterium]|nr:winged helix-turn-helix transcriptional regulator [Alphaproteobacteria bacterium]
MLDAIDRRIVALLQADGRMTNADLAASVNLSTSAAHRRVRQLEEAGVIVGYRAVIDPKKAGLSVLGYVSIKMESHDPKMLAAFVRGLEAIAEVVACSAISGGGDYLLKVVAADMDAFADVALKRLVRLPGVKDSTSNFVLATVKPEGAWPV